MRSHTDVDHPSDAVDTEAPSCPQCAGRMFDNRASKRNPRAPDYKCRNRSCEGVIWPDARGVRRLIHTKLSPDAPSNGAHGEPTSDAHAMLLAPLQRRYLACLQFTVDEVRPVFETVGVSYDSQTLAAIAATLFISLERQGNR